MLRRNKRRNQNKQINRRRRKAGGKENGSLPPPLLVVVVEEHFDKWMVNKGAIWEEKNEPDSDFTPGHIHSYSILSSRAETPPKI